MNWHIGQEIVCIKTHSDGVIKRGQAFVIQGLKSTFCNCKDVMIDVGIIGYNELLECTDCNIIVKDNTRVHWFSEHLFAPLEYNQEAIDELLKEPILIER